RFALDRGRMARGHRAVSRERMAVFAAFSGKKYADNPRSVSEALHQLDPSVQIVWLFHDPQGKQDLLPDYVIPAGWKTREGNAYLNRASAWVFNDPAPAYLYRGKDQLYIQCWHGDRGFKKILLDSENVKAKNEDPIVENKICSLMLAGSEKGAQKLASAFRYSGEIQTLGCPRNDALVTGNPARAKATREALGLDENERILLFAPTLRRAAFLTRGKQSIGGIDLPGVLKQLEETTGESWRCLVRAHSGVGGLKDVPEDGNITDVTWAEDMADLLLIADLLITDYSSSAGDFVLTGRPVILYQGDRAAYEQDDRSFYIDPDETPYAIAKTGDELMQLLADLPAVAKRDQAVMDFYGVNETGRASEAAARRILDWINGAS
ncbi:MAG: CDP-glycerol glycerophosphotransferase family protein, partial [Clostridia bacterium]|nr:CDP-glycerol glycerophosphotransferase family protein [Clostridia bacterium]